MISARLWKLRAIIGLIGLRGFCQDDAQDKARALRPPGTAYSDALLDSVEEEAREAIARIPRAITKEDAERARQPLRKQLQLSLGLERLAAPADLRPIVTGSIERPGYRLEKIIFQSLPNLMVPAHLYLPASPTDRAPAVLLYPDRSWREEGKSYHDAQAFGASMARMGFVVLTFDPIGQGERSVSSEDQGIPQMLLVGLSQAGIAEYEIQCALRYLTSRPEVDSHRIGMTGADGGGFMTWITAALDDHIAAAAIADDTEDFGNLIHRMRATDWDHAADQRALIPGILRYANNQELLAMFAPRPLLIISNSLQSGSDVSVRSIFDYGADIYGRFAANDKIRLFADSDDSPGYQRQKRQAAYRFFLGALMGQRDPQPLDEDASEIFPTFDSPALQCLPAGGSSPAAPAIMAFVTRIAATLPEPHEAVRIQDLMPPWPPRVRYGWSLGKPGIWRYVYSTQRGGYAIPWLFMLQQGERGMILALDDRGKEALVDDPVVLEAQKRGYAVSAIDMRGIGELAGNPGWLFAVNLLLGDNVEWKQALDALTLLDEWQDFTVTHQTGIYANGPVSSLAASYLMTMRQGPAPEFIVLRNGMTSFHELLDRQATTEGKGANEVPYWSIPFNGLSVDLMRPFTDRSTADVSEWVVEPLDPGRAKTILPQRVRMTGLEEFLSSDW